MSAHTHPVVRAYLARVRTALSDLPAAEVEEIVEDVRPHLTEIVERLGERASVDAVAEELGAPESYAAELRTAGEYPPAPSTKGFVEKSRPMLARAALAGLLAATICAAASGLRMGVNWADDKALPLLLFTVVLAAGSAGYLILQGSHDVWALPEVRKFVERTGLRGAGSRGKNPLQVISPVWWVVAAVLLGMFAFAAASSPLVVVTFLVLAGLMLWAGPMSAREWRWGALVLPLSALVVGGVVGTGGSIVQRINQPDWAYDDPYAYTSWNLDEGAESELYYGSRTLENLYVFDAEGQPLTDVYVYAEDGSPVLLPRYGCDPNTGEKIHTGRDNQFPRPRIEQGGWDEHGTVNGYNVDRPFCEEVEGVPFTVAVPSGK